MVDPTSNILMARNQNRKLLMLVSTIHPFSTMMIMKGKSHLVDYSTVPTLTILPRAGNEPSRAEL